MVVVEWLAVLQNSIKDLRLTFEHPQVVAIQIFFLIPRGNKS